MILRIIFSIVLGLLLAACGNSDAPAGDKAASVATKTDTHQSDSADHDADHEQGVPHDHADAAADEHGDEDHAGESHAGESHGDASHDDHDEAPGHVTIPAAIASEVGIRTAIVGAGVIRDEHEVQGLLTPIEGRRARVVARFPGPIRSVSVGVGDSVRAGQTLATVESNISLSNYSITAPLAGTVLARDAGVGELAGDTPLFEIADLSSLWVDLHLFGRDAQHITQGLPVVVTRLSDGVRADTTLDRILPATATASQSTVARATLANADGQWRPGAAVQARVTVAEDHVALVIPLAAVQRMETRDVVFVLNGTEYTTHPVTLGRRDGNNAEVLDGLQPGDNVVVEQSYLIKADIEKSGASHDH